MMEQFEGHVRTLQKWSEFGTLGDADGDNSNEQENNARVVILTGSDGNFCSGLDLHDHERNSSDNVKDYDDDDGFQPLQRGIHMTQHMTRLTNHLHSLPVLSISAIDGHAMGGGAELTTCTDLVVLSRTAKIQFVHARRGASVGWGGGRRLVKKVGRGKALRLLLLSECVVGEEEARCMNESGIFLEVGNDTNGKAMSGGLVGGKRMYADAVAKEGETALEAAMRLVVHPILELPCSQAVRAIKAAVSAADGDGDVIDSLSGNLRLDSNMALRGEMDSFVSVWGGDSNKEQIRRTKEHLKEKNK